MESNLEKTANISFTNGPKLSEHEVDKVYNDRRLKLIPEIKNFVSSRERFWGKEVTVSFFEKGVGSVVCILETADEKLVLKIPLSLTQSEGEGQFLNIWEQTGVKVPHVFETGKIGEHSFVLMEYIDAVPLSTELDTYDEQTKRETIMEMGYILHRMHSASVSGYGRCVGGLPEFATFKEWLENINPGGVKERIDYVLKNKVLDDENGSLSDMLKTLLDLVDKEKDSHYCHDDFGAANIFTTKPLTIFDPNPRFNHGYIDLGRSLYGTIAAGKPAEERELLLSGYFNGEPYDAKALHASVMLAAYMKLPYAHEHNRVDIIKRISEYLKNNKDLLKNSDSENI